MGAHAPLAGVTAGEKPAQPLNDLPGTAQSRENRIAAGQDRNYKPLAGRIGNRNSLETLWMINLEQTQPERR